MNCPSAIAYQEPSRKAMAKKLAEWPLFPRKMSHTQRCHGGICDWLAGKRRRQVKALEALADILVGLAGIEGGESAVVQQAGQDRPVGQRIEKSH